MRGKLITFYSERWAVWEIWQGCQVKDQEVKETSLQNGTSRTFNQSLMSQFAASTAFDTRFFSFTTLKAKSL